MTRRLTLAQKLTGSILIAVTVEVALVFGTFLGYFGPRLERTTFDAFEQFGVRRFGPAANGMVLFLQTPCGVALALLFLGESLHAYHLIGFALILPGVILATLRRRTARIAQPAG